MVIEGVPSELASEITRKVSCATIGIGAGVGCSGQVLVMHDLLGLSARSFTFTKAYADLRNVARDAVARYVDEVRQGEWPDAQHSFE